MNYTEQAYEFMNREAKDYIIPMQAFSFHKMPKGFSQYRDDLDVFESPYHLFNWQSKKFDIIRANFYYKFHFFIDQYQKFHYHGIYYPEWIDVIISCIWVAVKKNEILSTNINTTIENILLRYRKFNTKFDKQKMLCKAARQHGIASCYIADDNNFYILFLDSMKD